MYLKNKKADLTETSHFYVNSKKKRFLYFTIKYNNIEKQFYIIITIIKVLK